MTSPGGGFEFNVGFNIAKALSDLRNLQSAAAQAGQNIAQGLSSTVPSIDLGNIIQNLTQVNRALDETKSKGSIRIALTADGADQTLRTFQQLSQAATALARQRYTVNLGLNAQNLESNLRGAEETLRRATRGQVINLSVRLDESDSLRALQRLEGPLREAERRGVKIGVTLDTEGAKKDAEKFKREMEDRERGKIKYTVTTEGAQTTAAQLRQLDDIGRRISGRPITFQMEVDAGSARAVERFRQQLQLLQAGDNATIHLKGNAQQIDATVRHVEKELNDLRRKDVTVNITADPRSFSHMIQGILGGAGRGFIAGSGLGGSLLVGAGALTAQTAPILAAAVAMQTLTQATGAALQASIEHNRVLEQQVITFQHLTGSASKASQVMQDLRRLADISPFGDQEVLASGQAFLRVSAGDIDRAKELTELTVALAAAHPELGFEAMQLAIQQLVSGDYRAFEDRTNIAIGTVRELAKSGLSGMELYRAAVEKAGGSVELLNKQNQTFEARITATQSAVQGIVGALGEGLFRGMSSALGEINRVLVDNRQGWESVARAIGQAGNVIDGQISKYKPFIDLLVEVGKAFAIIERAQQRRQDQARGPESLRTPAFVVQPSDEDKQAAIAARDARIAAQKAVQSEIDKTTGELAKQNQVVKEQERAYKSIQLAILAITTEHEKQLIPLRAQIQAIEQMNVALERQQTFNTLSLTGAQQRLEDAKGPPEERADAAGTLALAELERDLIQIRHRRAEMTEEVAEREIAASRRIRAAAIDAQEAAVDKLRQEHQANQDVRNAALERLREEVRAQQEARNVALERLREEIRAHQEARQVALESLREQIRAQQEARQEALEGLREEIRARQEARNLALEAVRAEIEARREAYQQARDAQRELLEEQERAYQRAARAEDERHRQQSEARRREIELLRARDADLRRQEQELPAERELRAVEAANRERQRAISIAQAERNVLQARTGRERADALSRLRELQAQQEMDRQREAAQERLRQQQEARDRAQQARQERIQQLEQQAREEDRRYEEQKRVRDEQHRQQQERIQAQQREEDRAEKERQRQEDARVRELERQNKEAERAEAAQIREAEKADREQRKAEEAAIRAAEAAARAADRADQAKLREEERASKELERQENAAVRERERADREADRAEQARIRAEEARLAEARRAEEARRRSEDEAKDERRLQRIKEANEAELKVLEARERILSIQDKNAIAAATRDATLFQIIGQTLDNAQKAKDLMDQLTTLGWRAEIERVEADMAIKLAALEVRAKEMNLAVETARKTVSDLEARIEKLKRELAALQKPSLEERPLQGPAGTTPELIPKWVKDAFSSIFDPSSKSSFIGAGVELARWIFEGFARGLESNTPETNAAVDSWTNEAKFRAFSGWGANSPSTVTTELAYWVAQGFIQQMNFQAPFIAESVTQAFTVAIDPGLMTEAGTNTAFALSDAFIQQMNFQSEFIQQSMRAPFEEFLNVWLPGVPAYYSDIVDQSAQALVAAAQSDVIQAALRAPFEGFLYEWLEGVPQHYYNIAERSAAALTEGYTTVDIGQVLRAPFEFHINEWLPGVPQFYYDTAVASVASWVEGYQQPQDLSITLREPFEFHIEWLKGLPDIYRTTATDSTQAFTSGYRSPPDLFAVMRKPFEDFHLWARGLGPRFMDYGRTSATQFKVGFCAALDLTSCFNAAMSALVSSARTWGSQVGATFSSAAAAGAGQFGGVAPRGGGNPGSPSTTRAEWFNVGLNRRVITDGPPPSYDPQWVRTSPPPQISASSNQWGGRIGRILQQLRYGGLANLGQQYNVHENELIFTPSRSSAVVPEDVLRGLQKIARATEVATPRPAGALLPSSVLSPARTASAPAATTSVSNIGGHTINVEVNPTINATPGMDVNQLVQATTHKIGQEVIGVVIEALDMANRQATTRLPRHHPGAL